MGIFLDFRGTRKRRKPGTNLCSELSRCCVLRAACFVSSGKNVQALQDDVKSYHFLCCHELLKTIITMMMDESNDNKEGNDHEIVNNFAER